MKIHGLIRITILFLFLPNNIQAKVYHTSWGDGTPFPTKNDALQSLFFTSVIDKVTELASIEHNSDAYTLYQSYFASSFLQYIQTYTEHTVNNEPSESTFDIIVNEDLLLKTLARLQTRIHSTTPIPYVLIIDASLSHDEQKYISYVIQRINTVAHMKPTDNADITITLSKAGQDMYSGVFSSVQGEYAYKASTIYEVMEELIYAYTTSPSYQNNTQSPFIYTVEVRSVPNAHEIFELDTLLTQQLTPCIEDISLSNIISTQDTLSVVWTCTVHDKTPFVQSLHNILSVYPGITYTVSTHNTNTLEE